MCEPRWFDVELDTLALQPAALTDWPLPMSAPTARMLEESLESVVSFNLSELFPGERLLLVNTQHQIMNVADVLAVDPVGWVRVMELKKQPAGRGDLEDQVISYALHRQCQRPWPDLLAEALPELPERTALALEAFRSNRRSKSLGGAYASTHGFTGRWNDMDRFGKARVLCNSLRRERGEPPADDLDPLARTDVRVVARRAYGIDLARLDLSDPTAAFRAVVERWTGGYAPAAAGREFTVIAPRLAGTSEEQGRLEARGAFFNLIDAELRHEPDGQGRVSRAVLRWAPVRRTADGAAFRRAAELAAAMRRLHPDVPLPRFDLLNGGRTRWWHWHGDDRFRLSMEQEAGGPHSGEAVLATAASWLTEGMADLRRPRMDALKALLQALGPTAGARPFGGSGEICVPLSGDMTAAAHLAAEYYKVLEQLGCFEPYRWHRRPAPRSSVSSGDS